MPNSDSHSISINIAGVVYKRFSKPLRSLITLSGGAVLGFFALTNVALAADFSTIKLQQYIQTQKTVTKATPNSAEAKMGASLLDSVRSGSSKAIGGKLPVIIKAKSGSGYRVASQLKQKGIAVQSQVGDTIYARTYANSLQNIAGISLVDSFSLQPSVSIDTNVVDDLLSQIGLGDDTHNNANTGSDSNNDGEAPPANRQRTGVIPNRNDAGNLSIYVNELHNKGIYGDDIKIGVIDFGYNGYNTLKSKGVLPEPEATAMFVQGNQQSSLNTSSGTPHGTACTEIIYNLAPNAAYYLAQIGDGKGNANGGDLLMAIDWMVSQGVNVINFSGGGHGEQHNGEASLDKKVEEVVGKGVLWINAAGNEGNDHWGGAITDKDNNSLVDLNGYNFLEVQSYGNPFRVIFNWDDWGDTSAYENIDLDGYLINAQGDVVVRQEIKRNPKSQAVDSFVADVPKGHYAIALSTNKVSRKMLHVVVSGAKLIDLQPHGSIGVPATSKAALSVGAWDVISKDIADYSSRGKTDDNRIKPEIAAPTNVLSASYQLAENTKRFQGTSAAAPYATGFAALVWSANPQWSTQEIKQYLQSMAVRPLSSMIPNVDSGYGIIDARRVVGSAGSQASPSYSDPAYSNTPSSSVPSNSSQDNQVVDDLLNSIGL